MTTAFPILQTERLTLRAPNGSDLPAMLAFFGSERARFYAGPMSEADAWRRFAAYTGQWMLCGYGFFAVTLRDSGETVGLAGPYHPAEFPEPEMSWLLSDAAHEGKGYATEARHAVLKHLYNDLGWSSVVSYIDADNHASRAVAERLDAMLDPAAEVPLPGCAAYRHTPEGLRA